MTHVPQVVPSKVCLSCDVCCRFPERDSFLRPYFTQAEIERAIKQGINSAYFLNAQGSQVEVVPNPSGEGYLCPAFDHETSHCRIYEVRPIDCQLYPFMLMWDEQHETVLLGWDTKCPYVFPEESHAMSSPHTSSLRVFSTLPPEIVASATQLTAQLEEGELRTTVADYPSLVTPYQDDVVIIQPLPKLTRAMQASHQ